MWSHQIGNKDLKKKKKKQTNKQNKTYQRRDHFGNVDHVDLRIALRVELATRKDRLEGTQHVRDDLHAEWLKNDTF